MLVTYEGSNLCFTWYTYVYVGRFLFVGVGVGVQHCTCDIHEVLYVSHVKYGPRFGTVKGGKPRKVKL